MTPDHHAIIGPGAKRCRLVFCQRFQRSRRNALPCLGSNHGRLDLQGHSDLIDAAQLSVERFADGRLLEETAVL